MTTSPGQDGLDILYGADEIALFLFGDAKQRRRVYVRAAKSEIPVFRIGANICARKSVLVNWMERQERGALGSLPNNRSDSKS